MTIGVPVRFVVSTPDDLVPCFDATAPEVFATSCHLADGDREAAEALLIDVYLALRRAIEAGATVDVDHHWIVATALRQVLGEHPDGTNESLTARERAVIELHLLDGADVEAVAVLLGLTTDEVLSSLARYDDSIPELSAGPVFSTGLVDDLLHRSELWLDDATRRRARAALRAGRRSDRVAPPVHDGRASPELVGLVGFDGSVSERRVSERVGDAAESLPRPRRRSIVFGALALAAVAAVAVGVVATSGDGPRPSGASDSTSADSTVTSGGSTVATAAGPADGVASAASADDPSMPASGGGASVEPAQRTPTLAPGFVLERPPTGFEIAGGNETVDPPLVGRFQVWAEPDATRTSGRWLAVSTMTTNFSRTAIIPNGVRETIGSSPAVMAFDSDGVPVLTVQPPDAGQFSITGGGFSADELRQIAVGITLFHGDVTFDPALDTLRADLPLVHDAPAEIGGLAAQVLVGPRRTTTFVEIDGPGYIELTAQSTTADDLRISELILPASTDTFASSTLNRTIHMGLLELSISGAPQSDRHDDGRSSVRWHVGDETITMSGNVGLYQLLGVAGAARQASGDEWSSLFRMDQADLDPATIGSDPDLIQIGVTTTDDSSRWTVAMLPEPLTVQLAVRNYSVYGVMGEEPIALDSLHPVHEFVSMSSTTIVVVTSSPEAATGVRIVVAGQPPTTLPLVKIADTGTVAAALTFRDVSPYTVALVDDEGEIVEALTP